jgi:hypothetical protein
MYERLEQRKWSSSQQILEEKRGARKRLVLGWWY